MNIDLAPEANHISKIKCEHRSDHSSLAACCEPSFINYEIKTLRPHLHLHGGSWFQTVNCIDLEEAHSSEMCSIKYTWEQFPREFSESLCLLPLMLFGRSAAVCSVLQSLLVLCHCSLQATVHQCASAPCHCSIFVLCWAWALCRTHWWGWDASKDSRGVWKCSDLQTLLWDS